MTIPEPIVHNGLQEIVAAQTHLSSVDGQAGELVIAGYPLPEFADKATFEETVYLLWHDHLPIAHQLTEFSDSLVSQRQIPQATLALLREAAAKKISVMDALRMAADSLSLDTHDDQPNESALLLVARFPTIVAAYWRLLNNQQPVSPRHDLGHAANYLYMLFGETPSPDHVRALDTYLNTVVDHGLNASTFTARVITSTGSDMVSAVVGALGALKGPLHGGAPGPALDMVFEIGETANAEPYLRQKLERGDRLMGFGHRVYKVRDPRADVLSAAAAKMAEGASDTKLYDLAHHVEKTAVRLLEEYKPGRNLQTNVEFYTALVLHGLGMTTDLFTPTFAISRVGGWIAHAFEQQREGRLIRPKSVYSGVKDRRWQAIEARKGDGSL